jgi:hypothetical protein
VLCGLLDACCFRGFFFFLAARTGNRTIFWHVPTGVRKNHFFRSWGTGSLRGWPPLRAGCCSNFFSLTPLSSLAAFDIFPPTCRLFFRFVSRPTELVEYQARSLMAMAIRPLEHWRSVFCTWASGIKFVG